mmetsp:Transcript_58162/g.138448  ORF Transcript_58162/g.138448 Transcript_58162/m.138448 type:complete len:393 (+) Transcript_58162:55-1233(+)
MGDEEDGEVEDEVDILENPVIIIDNGSGICKAGLSSDQNPSNVFLEAIGRPRQTWKNSASKPAKEYFCGDEILPHMDKLSITHPIENGIIEDFELMELVWEHTFVNELQVDPSQHALLLTEPPFNPKPNREKMVEIMFETFGVPSMNISIQGVLALQGQGRTTGLVLDSGEGVTYTLPIFDGFALPHCINRLDLAGRELNTLLAKLLAQEQRLCLTTTAQQHQTRLMKESLCYCALDPSSEFAEAASYKLPDGSQIELRDEQWKCPEALFNPSMVGLESAGVAGLIWDSIQRCEIDLRKTLLSNVVLSGGSTMFPKFTERITKELRAYAPSAAHQNVRVVHSKHMPQKYVVWSGAQVFANLRSLQEDQWMNFEDYDEYGPSFIHDKISVRYS